MVFAFDVLGCQSLFVTAWREKETGRGLPPKEPLDRDGIIQMFVPNHGNVFLLQS